MNDLFFGLAIKLSILLFLGFLFKEYRNRQDVDKTSPKNVPALYVKCKRNEFIEATIPFWGREVNSKTVDHLCLTKSRTDDLRSASRSFLEYEHKPFKVNTQCDYMNALAFLGAESKNKSLRATDAMKMDLKTLSSHHCYVSDDFEDLVNQTEKMVQKMETSEDCLKATECKDQLFFDTKEFLRKIDLVYTMDESPKCIRNETIKATIPVWGRVFNSNHVDHLCINKTITQVLRNASLDFLKYEQAFIIENAQCDFMNILLNLGAESKNISRRAPNSVKMDFKTLSSLDCYISDLFEDLVNQTEKMVLTMKTSDGCLKIDECKDKLFFDTKEFIRKLDRIYIMDESPKCKPNESIKATIPVRGREVKRKSVEHLCMRKTITQVLRNASLDFLIYKKQCEYMNILFTLGEESKNEAQISPDAVEMDFENLLDYDCFANATFFDLVNQTKLMVDTMKAFEDCIYVDECKEQLFRWTGKFIVDLNQFYILPREDTTKCERNDSIQATIPVWGRELKSKSVDHLCINKKVTQVLRNASVDFLKYELEPINENVQCDYMNVLSLIGAESKDEAQSASDPVDMDLQILSSYDCFSYFQFDHLANLAEIMVEKIETFEECLNVDKCKDQFFLLTKKFIKKLDQSYIMPKDDRPKCQRTATIKAITPRWGRQVNAEFFDYTCLVKELTQGLQKASHDFLINEKQCDYMNVLLSVVAEREDRSWRNADSVEMDLETLRSFDCFPNLQFRNLVNLTEIIVKRIEASEDCVDLDECKDQLFRDTENFIILLDKFYIIPNDDSLNCKRNETIQATIPYRGRVVKSKISDHFCISKAITQVLRTASIDILEYGQKPIKENAQCDFINVLFNLGAESKNETQIGSKFVEMNPKTLSIYECFSNVSFVDLVNQTERMVKKMKAFDDCLYEDECKKQLLQDTQDLLAALNFYYLLDEKEFFRCDHPKEIVPIKLLSGTINRNVDVVCVKKVDKQSLDIATKEFLMYREDKAVAEEDNFLRGEEKKKMGNITALCQYIQKLSSLENAYKDQLNDSTNKLNVRRRVLYDHSCFRKKEFSDMMNWPQKAVQTYENDNACYWKGDCLQSVFLDTNKFQENLQTELKLGDVWAYAVLMGLKAGLICFEILDADEMKKEFVPFHTEEEFKFIKYLASIYKDMSFHTEFSVDGSTEHLKCVENNAYYTLKESSESLTSVNPNAYLNWTSDYKFVMRTLNRMVEALSD